MAADLKMSEDDPNEAVLTPRQPRHVYQMARTVFFKIQKLRFLNGLPQADLPVPPTRDILPKDVYSLVSSCLSSLRDLRPSFEITQPPPASEFIDGKMPTDVFRELRRASLMLNSLGIPEVAPNDVMRVALTIVSDLQLLLRRKNIPDVFPIAPRSRNKAPEDVYRMGYRVLLRLKELSDLVPNLRPPGGIVLPNDRRGTIVPGHVEERLNDVLAEVMSIKARLRIDRPTEMAGLQAGKTPSDVFGAVAAAEAMVARLLPWPM